MADDENKDVAEGQLLPNNGNNGNKTPNADAYENLIRGLTPDELSQSGTQKLILNDLKKSELKVVELEPFRNKFHQVDKEKSVLEEKIKKNKKAEILYSFATTVGGIIIGLAKIFYDKNIELCVFMFGIGALLIAGGIIFKNL